MVRPIIDPDTQENSNYVYGVRWGSYIQDTTSGQVQEWGGVNVLQNDTIGDNQQYIF